MMNCSKYSEIKNLRRMLYVDDIKWEEKYKDYSRTILLFITDKCNLSCDYCFNEPNLYKSNSMTIEYIKKVVEANPRIDKYDIMGGEPLLHKDLNNIIYYLESKNKKVGLYTNGYYLSKLNNDFNNLKINISFQSIISNNKSFKPINDLFENIVNFQKIYPIKLVFLLNNYNKKILFDVAMYIEENFLAIRKLTIGSVRNEKDYWNDNYSYILPSEEYYNTIQNFINLYNGRLNIEIFTKGILYTNNLPQNREYQLNRFKNVFPNNKYSPCLYLIANDVKLTLDFNTSIPFSECTYCEQTGLLNCLADKIYLFNKKNGNYNEKYK